LSIQQLDGTGRGNGHATASPGKGWCSVLFSGLRISLRRDRHDLYAGTAEARQIDLDFRTRGIHHHRGRSIGANAERSERLGEASFPQRRAGSPLESRRDDAGAAWAAADAEDGFGGPLRRGFQRFLP